MSHELKSIKQKILGAKAKMPKIEQCKKTQEKQQLYLLAAQKVKKNKNLENTNLALITIEKILSYLKIATIFAIFAAIAIGSYFAFTEKSDYLNAKVILEETRADEINSNLAIKFTKQLLHDISSKGISALNNYFHTNTDEESKYWTAELLGSIDSDNIEPIAVTSLPNSNFKVYCDSKKFKFSFLLAKHENKFSLIRIE